MLTYKKGDLVKALLQGDVLFIGHQANCFNTMNSGVAKQIRLFIPAAYEIDQATTKGSREKLGGYSYSNNVFNLYSQYNYGNDGTRYTDYTALASALRAMRNSIDERITRWTVEYLAANPVKIGFPRIGCGLGGGDWSVVARLIEDAFKGYSVFIYEL